MPVHLEFAGTPPGGARIRAMDGMGGAEAAPAVFAGAVFVLFGGALLAWTGARVRHREPVADGGSPAVSAALATVFGVAFLVAGVWCFTRI
ncbi:hypothetical protein ACT1U9_13910 [Streptomyces sp. BR1]|uniref:hypothetical protein n=1 Tax=Streptomyces sp. BR1 TaxID=1592323 RepID=UPI00402B479C